MTSSAELPIAVLGAGLAGLTAARSLAAAGESVVVADKGRSVGGRLATRRIGGATLDHGAQFFTVRTDAFAADIGQAVRDDVVYEWCRGFGHPQDGHPRYAVRGGMNRLAKHLADGLDVRTSTHVSAVRADERWSLVHPDGTIEARALVLTAPMPQNLALLDAGAVELDHELRRALDAVAYHPALAALLVLDRSPELAAPAGFQLEDGPFTFVADNQGKGISAVPALTLHLDHELSADRWDDDPDAVLADVTVAAAPYLGPATVTEAQLKAWRYARPRAPASHAIEHTDVGGLPLVFAGDAFADAAVEGAYTSGRAAAHHLIARR